MLKPHPAAAKFPLLGAAELAELAEDIRENGQIEKAVVFEGLLLDGRNRAAACKLLGRELEVRELKRCNSPTAYVVSANIRRRHLTLAQKYALAHELKPLFEAEAKARQRAGGKAAGRGRPQQVGGKGPPTYSGKRKPRAPRALELAAKAAGVGEKTMRKVEKALALAPEVRAAIDAGASAEDALRLAKLPESLRKKAVAAVVGGSKTSDAIREVVRSAERTALESVAVRKVKAAAGLYDVIVIDPPWPMKKIARDERPMQAEMDYPTMSEADLALLKIPCAEAAHVWVWTTARFLPMALRLINAWQLTYVCPFVWHKPGGFQPQGLPQFNLELALYCRRGAPRFLDTRGFVLCFGAERGAHSEKPEVFYDMVRRVTAGRRLDMFSRRRIDGFDGWGNEA